MHDFSLDLRLDSPLLLGGAEAQKLDPSGMLSGLAMRGLFRTFARALIGPFVNQDWDRIRAAENKLLGAAGGAQNDGAVYRVQDVSPGPLDQGPTKFQNRPGDESKNRRGGYSVNQGRSICIRPRPTAARDARDVQLLPEMLAAVAWSAFAFGAMGGRSRRGYGSLTIEQIRDFPVFDNERRFEKFTTQESDKTLSRKLRGGLILAQAITKRWLVDNGFNPQSPRANPPATLFELFGPRYVFAGTVQTGTDQQVMEKLMDAASNAKRSEVYGEYLGSANPRLASPLWVRLYKTDGGFIPIATLSPIHTPDNTTAEALVDQLLKSIGAIDNRGVRRSLESIAGGSP